MSYTLNVYRSTNDLTYSELPPPDHGDLAPPHALDEDEIKKENALEFYRFELAFLQVSGAQDQLETYAATQENLAKDGQQAGKQDDPVWTQIQNGVKNEITQVGSKIQDGYTTDASEHQAVDDPVMKASKYADSMAKTGVADQSFLSALLPSSTGEWIACVARRTRLNELIGWWRRLMSSPARAEFTADNECLRRAERADALYDLLAAQHCSGKGHKSLLQLSGWADSSGGESVFQMFLSSCSDDGWQRATCSFESSGPGNSAGHQIDICSKIQHKRRREVPLLLSFNHDRLWMAKGKLSFLSEYHKEAATVDLETLIADGDLRTSDLDVSVRKFRFAVRLALSLYSLYFGPWIQQDWSSRSVHIIPDRDGSRVEMLDEAYISCDITTGGKQIYTRTAPSQETSSTEVCPPFFLSLAQLLVDIEYGKTNNQSPGRVDPDSWYKQLANEVRNNKDELMRDYWDAIQGCLLYQENFDNQCDYSIDEGEKRLRAQRVIYEHIVLPLQKNLNSWKQQQKVPNINDAKRCSKTPQPHGKEQRSACAQRVNDDSPAAALSPGPRAGLTVNTKFTLWSNQDDDYKIVEKPTEEPSESSFISHMKTFRDTYIETLPEPTGDGDTGKAVRVAIIDTGLYIEEADFESEGDSFLDHADVKSRVRVVDRQNFFSADDKQPDPNDWEDEHGHGTLVARLVLQFAPRAEVVVAKISNSRTLTATKATQLVNALRWAGGKADIINLSFSLGPMPEPEVEQVIKDLISDNKLIFAAASNTGPYGSRMWPATRPGVFAVHATNEFGTIDSNMNPQPRRDMENFATFGCDVKSYWKGHHRSISGTSFATPVAAAIAANILEFARRTQPEKVVRGLARYSAMRDLFRNEMTPNGVDSAYHCFRPWAPGLWDGNLDRKNINDVLWKRSI